MCAGVRTDSGDSMSQVVNVLHTLVDKVDALVVAHAHAEDASDSDSERSDNFPFENELHNVILANNEHTFEEICAVTDVDPDVLNAVINKSFPRSTSKPVCWDCGTQGHRSGDRDCKLPLSARGKHKYKPPLPPRRSTDFTRNKRSFSNIFRREEAKKRFGNRDGNSSTFRYQKFSRPPGGRRFQMVAQQRGPSGGKQHYRIQSLSDVELLEESAEIFMIPIECKSPADIVDQRLSFDWA